MGITMKGFKKDGKFRPTGNKSKSSLKKSDVRKKIEIVDVTKEPMVKKSDGTYELSANDKKKFDAFFGGKRQPTLPRDKQSLDSRHAELRADLDSHSESEKKQVLSIFETLGYENLDADGKYSVDYLRGNKTRSKKTLDDSEESLFKFKNTKFYTLDGEKNVDIAKVGGKSKTLIVKSPFQNDLANEIFTVYDDIDVIEFESSYTERR